MDLEPASKLMNDESIEENNYLDDSEVIIQAVNNDQKLKLPVLNKRTTVSGSIGSIMTS